MTTTAQDDVDVLSSWALETGSSVAVAESLTCGKLVSRLGSGQDAGRWLAGGVVAYSSEVKFTLLGVDRGPVVTASCASQMAEGARRMFASDVAVAVTGVGGPDPEEGKPPGTVFVACTTGGPATVESHCFDGDPTEVMEKTLQAAVRQLASAVGAR